MPCRRGRATARCAVAAEPHGSSGPGPALAWPLLLAVLAVLAVGATVAVTLSAPAAPDVVPYPTVTGPLGDHLKDLQKGVEP